MGVAVPFNTIPELFRNLMEKYAEETRPVLMHKVDGTYRGITYPDLAERVNLFACGLASLGLKRGDRVSIVSENRPEWLISDQAIVGLGAVDAPIYPTNTAKQIAYIIADAGARFVIVSNQFQLNKILKVIDELPHVEKVIIMTEKGAVTNHRVVGFSAVMQLGREFHATHPDYFRREAAQVKPEDLLTLIYTSGTTGNPKGVMLTHGNLVSNILNATKVLWITEGDKFLSFLPLCHSFERMAGYYAAFACGSTIAYAESIETVRDNMVEVQPTIIGTVPRLFERVHSRILKQVDAGTPKQRRIFAWAIGTGRSYAIASKKGALTMGLRLRHALADRLVFRKVRARTGGKIKFFVSGGAALPREFGEFFEAVGLRIIEGYGLTETSPVISVNPYDAYKFGSVGKPIPGIEVKIDVDGEILTRGPHVMKGYWNDPQATSEIIDKEGWLHTGDIGVVDAEGYLHITDRKKHLFVSSGGKNIAPQPIENLFLSSRYIEQFVLIGDRRMFLTALIVPDFDALKEYADAHGISYSSAGELVKHKVINDLIEKDIAAIQKDLATYERVRKFALLEKPFTIEDGEITPSMKVRRKIVEERYAALIEEMYRGIN